MWPSGRQLVSLDQDGGGGGYESSQIWFVANRWDACVSFQMA